MNAWLICYDIADDTRRLRVASWLKRFGQRVQESVFEVSPKRAADFDRLWQGLIERTTPEDNLRAYPLPAIALNAARTLNAEPPRTLPHALVL